jgi:hypothetical protein
VKEGGLNMGDYYWMDSVKKIINSVAKGYYETRPPLVDPYIIPDSMYPYTFEQTVKVTHYSKPKRRDPARNWRKQ